MCVDWLCGNAQFLFGYAVAAAEESDGVGRGFDLIDFQVFDDVGIRARKGDELFDVRPPIFEIAAAVLLLRRDEFFNVHLGPP